MSSALTVAVLALFVALAGIAAMSFIAARGIQQTKREAFRQLSDVLDHSNVQDSRIRKSIRDIDELHDRMDTLEARIAELAAAAPKPKLANQSDAPGKA